MVRTSLSNPIEVAWTEVTTPGRLGLTFAPGKKARSAFGSPWDRDLELDLAALRAAGVDVLGCLLEDHELTTLKIPALFDRAAAHGLSVLRLPIEDGGVPALEGAQALVAEVVGLLEAGRSVVYHCRGGLGRAGTLTACTRIQLGDNPSAAMAEVRRVRPGAIENSRQEAFVHAYRTQR
ncbi:MAG: cyclin-dependent kinase inhibitor 3 family protein [Myxococcota bacterium]